MNLGCVRQPVDASPKNWGGRDRRTLRTMRTKKQNSPALERAVTRAAAISSIGATLELGNDLSVEAFNASIADTRGKLDTYNQLLSQVDAARVQLKKAEKELSGRSRRMLSGVLATYGPDSLEYEKAGGTRSSARRRPVRAANKITAPTDVKAA